MVGWLVDCSVGRCGQALYRMHQGKTSFKAKKEAAAVISRAWMNGQATMKVREGEGGGAEQDLSLIHI